MRYNGLFWLIIFVLGLINFLLEFSIWQKMESLNYLALTLASDAIAFVLTAGLLLWSNPYFAQPTFRIWPFVLASVGVTLLFMVLDNFIWFITMREFEFDVRLFLNNSDSNSLPFFVWTSLYLAFVLHQQRRRRLEESSQLSQKIQQLELQALRHQLNPHFTFNALNSVCALIEAERFEDAELMSEQLAAFLRYSIRNSPEQLVPLADELSAITAYLALQKTRFGEKLQVQWQVEPTVSQYQIPPLLLQPLVENSIKYAVASRSEGATIVIRGSQQGQQLHLSILDDGPGRVGSSPETYSAGIGLANIKARLEQHFGEHAQLTVDAQPQGFAVHIQLPVKRGQ